MQNARKADKKHGGEERVCHGPQSDVNPQRCGYMVCACSSRLPVNTRWVVIFCCAISKELACRLCLGIPWGRDLSLLNY